MDGTDSFMSFYACAVKSFDYNIYQTPVAKINKNNGTGDLVPDYSSLDDVEIIEGATETTYPETVVTNINSNGQENEWRVEKEHESIPDLFISATETIGGRSRLCRLG